MKPGWQTSEAWITLAAKLLSCLVAFGVIDASQQAQVETNVTNAIVGAFAILTLASMAKNYANNRTILKKLDAKNAIPNQ